jgi:hypothetical protein
MDNPYLSDPGIDGLIHNLQNLPPEWADALFTDAYAPQRLAAIAHQAGNIKDQALLGVQTAGTLLAQAASAGNLDANEVARAGWLVEFLAQLAATLDGLAASASHTQEHGALIRRPPT